MSEHAFGNFPLAYKSRGKCPRTGRQTRASSRCQAQVPMLDARGPCQRLLPAPPVKQQNHTITDSLSLEKTSKIRKFNHQSSTTSMFTTKPCPQCHIHRFFFNTSRDGDSTTALGSLFQCLTTLSKKKFFLIANLNIHCLNLTLFPPIACYLGE